MHASQREREFLKSEQMETASIEFHRSGRAALYQKIETMLQGYDIILYSNLFKKKRTHWLLLHTIC